MLFRFLLSFCFVQFLTTQLFADFLPPNNLHLEDDIYRFDANMTEETFNNINQQIVSIYEPIVSSLGGRLVMNASWGNTTVNASAMQSWGSWQLNMFGGLARRPEVTPDGYALVVCHELGHHLGGFPFSGAWAANEGQADYFATQECARKIWGDELETNAQARLGIDATGQAMCDNVWSSEEDQNLCYRSVLAGQSLANLLSALNSGSKPSLNTPSKKVVSRTYDQHPEGQCRLDTYAQGALCTVSFDETVIPGKKSQKGKNNTSGEEEAYLYSCARINNFEIGVRPRCWYAPKVK